MTVPPRDDRNNDYTIASVDRALGLLEILGRIGPTNLAHLAKEAHCTRTGAFRLLRTMQSRGFVVQDGPRGNWHLGARLDALRQVASEQGALIVTAGPRLASLAQEIGEVVYLLRRSGLEAEILAIHQGKGELHRYGAVGVHRPLHAGAGRLLLAYAPNMILEQLSATPLPRYTPVTITDPKRITADLARVRTRGWLITENETELGTASINAPVRDEAGEVVAMVTIFGSTLRLRGSRPRELLPKVIQAAEDISRTLGWNDRRRTKPAG